MLYGNRWKPTGKAVGEGGQGHVLWVEDTQSEPPDKEYTLKKLKNPKRLGRFQAEVEALQRIDSERIPKILDFSVDDPAYLVTEFRGPSLDKVMAGRSLSFDEGLDLVRDVVEAVRDAHAQGVVHRDIKPQNVVVSDGRAWLIDFGICQFEDGGFLNTLVDEAFGNRSFAAPECELGSAQQAGPPADVYSLGKLTYWILSAGRYLHREQLDDGNIEAIGAPRGLERPFIARILRKTVSQNPNDRITAQDLLDEVQRDGELIRKGINAAGSKTQKCQTCAIGTMRQLNELGIATIGLRPANQDPKEALRVLQCGHCGLVRIHFLHETTGKQLWGSD